MLGEGKTIFMRQKTVAQATDFPVDLGVPLFFVVRQQCCVGNLLFLINRIMEILIQESMGI
jgi:hypothetical protein